MYLPQYQLSASRELTYEFTSEGPKGLIVKQIQFTLVNRQNVYNLAFGDKDATTGDIDDTVISNNGDRERVLATIVGAVFAFLAEHDQAWIFAAGSNSARTRLYQMGITRYFEEVQDDLEIYGQFKNDWQPFQRGVNYDAFIVRLKSP